MNNHNKYLDLRAQYPFFEFQSYSFTVEKQSLKAHFVFNTSDQIWFTPGFEVPSRGFYNFEKLDDESLRALVFHIGMVELISYWKATCSPQVIIRPHLLTTHQAEWWKKLYFQGLGEFFYLNGIDVSSKDFMSITSKGEQTVKVKTPVSGEKVLVPIGGGKDSIVTLELLKSSNLELVPMLLNPREANVRTIGIAGFDISRAAVINRSLDKNLLELNARGYLNGHTPFSSLLAFFSLLLAAGSGVKYIALSNESSANESTVPGTGINHQYSKSLEFENDFREYAGLYLNDQIEYFSFLRPLNELQIAELFSGFPAYFSGFRSCNAGSKTDSWCGSCPKCLFTWLILSPFIPQPDLGQIFGKHVLDDLSLQPIMDELTGKTAIKPFECVGTPEEVKTAAWKTIGYFGGNALPALLQDFAGNFGIRNADEDFSALIQNFEGDHHIPSELLPILKEALINPFRRGFIDFLRNCLTGIHKLLIMGFGREGRSTYRLLQKHFPGIRLTVADRSASLADADIPEELGPEELFLGPGYEKALSQFPLTIKSPGVKLADQYHDEGSVTSQTQLFLEYYRKQTIGVTGTKGKSTTVSIIHHILNKAGKDNVLLGNIGIPPFDRIDLIKEETIIIFELSAHQLQGITCSPSIGVLLNVFPEHLDHFGSFEDYWQAKANLFRFQEQDDVLIIHESLAGEIDLPASRVEIFGTETQNLATFSAEKESLPNNTAEWTGGRLPLPGRHNELNLLAAMQAVSHLGIPLEQSLEYIADFKPLPHRLEFVGEVGNVKFYNDSISTVPESTIAALKALKDTDTLILGGYDRGLDYTSLVGYLRGSGIRNIVLMGQVGKLLMTEFDRQPEPGSQYFYAEKLTDAFPFIFKHTRKGGICLLSPAAASYDQYHNFEHRGDTFRGIVSELMAKQKQS